MPRLAAGGRLGRHPLAVVLEVGLGPLGQLEVLVALALEAREGVEVALDLLGGLLVGRLGIGLGGLGAGEPRLLLGPARRAPVGALLGHGYFSSSTTSASTTSSSADSAEAPLPDAAAPSGPAWAWAAW